ncbi:uncharacterized protein LOC135120639 isoform X2 [Zophobas morio]|uniref:uncharacterized protein LOC135120639 isoform X2 n=1 Tax=Zophobas morio TaxID=2755281 RepID=UPI003082C316
MTILYKNPTYYKLEHPQLDPKLFDKYSLVYYTEQDTKQFTGHPVLFIPGNAGSRRQVRALASVSTQMSKNINNSINFDYFAVDFNEELTAMYGVLALRQTEYVGRCIAQILEYYNNKTKKIVIIGYSMGGVIARAVSHSAEDFLSKDLQQLLHNRISLVLTLATPHRPVFVPDIYMAFFYYKLNCVYEREKQRRPEETALLPPLVFISGGDRDFYTRYGWPSVGSSSKYYERIYESEKNRSRLSTLLFSSTYEMPNTCLSADHKSIVWCRQVIIEIVRTLFNMNEIVARNNTSAVWNSFYSFEKRKNLSSGNNIGIHLPDFTIVDVRQPPHATAIRQSVAKNTCYHYSSNDTQVTLLSNARVDSLFLCGSKQGEPSKQCGCASENCHGEDITLRIHVLPFDSKLYTGGDMDFTILQSGKPGNTTSRTFSYLLVELKRSSSLLVCFKGDNSRDQEEYVDFSIPKKAHLQFPKVFSKILFSMEKPSNDDSGVYLIQFTNDFPYAFISFYMKITRVHCTCSDRVLGVLGEKELCHVSRREELLLFLQNSQRPDDRKRPVQLQTLTSCCSYNVEIAVSFWKTAAILFQHHIFDAVAVGFALIFRLSSKLALQQARQSEPVKLFSADFLLIAYLYSFTFTSDLLSIFWIGSTSAGFVLLLYAFTRILLFRTRPSRTYCCRRCNTIGKSTISDLVHLQNARNANKTAVGGTACRVLCVLRHS